MKFEELIEYKPARSPANYIDRTGWENEYFKIVSRAPNSKAGRTIWNCLCKNCGNISSGRHTSCGCTRKQNIGKALRKDLTGQRFGMLIAKEYAGYSNSSGNAVWICDCDCGNTCKVDSNNLIALHTLSCGCINSSIGADSIEKLLIENNIPFKKEYSIDLYFTNKNNPSRLDFVIFDDEIKTNVIRAIEYDGIQHFKETWGAWKGNISLAEQQSRDKQKNEWCKQHNIALVRIPYTERDNITLDMILGDKYLI